MIGRILPHQPRSSCLFWLFRPMFSWSETFEVLRPFLVEAPLATQWFLGELLEQ